MEKNAKIYVAGHRGMVGSAIVRELNRQGYTNIVTRTHRELDLCRQAEELINGGYIGGGMLPKLANCTSAIRSGVRRVHILDGRIPHCLLLEIFTRKGIGTAIVDEGEVKEMES